MKNKLRVLIYIVFILISNIPLLATILTALKTPAQLSESPPSIFFIPTLQNFIEVFTSPKLNFIKYLINSFSISLLGTIMSLILSLPAAYAIVRNNVGKKFILPFVSSLRIVPLIIYAIPFYFMFQTLHLLDSILGLAIIACLINIPLSLVVFVGFFQDMPIELEEAAYMDGASTFQVIMKIILPLATTVIASIAIINFIFAWNEFLFGLFLTTRKAIPVTVGGTFFITSYGVKWGQTAAAITLSVLPPILVGLFSFKYLTRALLAGAIKG